MPDRIEWCLFLGVATCSALSAMGCSPSAVSCTETATCPPTVRPDSGVDAPNDVDESDAGSSADLSIDAIAPPEDVSVDASIDAGRDAGRAEDVDASTGNDTANDTRVDMAWPDVPVIDVGSEPDACDPGTAKSPMESACLISEKYGIFVSPQGSDTTGIGTRAAPYKTLTKALQSAKGNVMRVYACDEGTGYPDALALDATLDGMSLYGGFECGGWTYATTRRARVHPASGVALSVKALTVGLTVEDFEFDAADAATGESSIGAIVDSSANVVLRGVKIVAGKGGGGANGADGAKGDDGPDAGSEQNGFPAQCPYGGSAQLGGGWLNSSTCGSQGGSQGGGGGTATKNGEGTAGVSGTPKTDVTPPDVNNGGDKGPVGTGGDAGSPGNAGGAGMASSGAGTFGALGYTVATAGGVGTAGHVGQGGGGGGASNAAPLTNCVGASGGAGGMGGCGGSPGTGGASAGASVALLAWLSPLTLDRCELTSAAGGGGGNGGKGGKGGAGKDGGSGGAAYTGDAGPAPDAGVALGKGGNGGPGGPGGNGGSGAGGSGGPSYGVVYKGTAPTKLNGTVLAHGAGGTKGTGGSVDTVKAPDGLVGTAADDFAVP